MTPGKKAAKTSSSSTPSNLTIKEEQSDNDGEDDEHENTMTMTDLRALMNSTKYNGDVLLAEDIDGKLKDCKLIGYQRFEGIMDMNRLKRVVGLFYFEAEKETLSWQKFSLYKITMHQFSANKNAISKRICQAFLDDDYRTLARPLYS